MDLSVRTHDLPFVLPKRKCVHMGKKEAPTGQRQIKNRTKNNNKKIPTEKNDSNELKVPCI